MTHMSHLNILHKETFFYNNILCIIMYDYALFLFIHILLLLLLFRFWVHSCFCCSFVCVYDTVSLTYMHMWLRVELGLIFAVALHPLSPALWDRS